MSSLCFEGKYRNNVRLIQSWWWIIRKGRPMFQREAESENRCVWSVLSTGFKTFYEHRPAEFHSPPPFPLNVPRRLSSKCPNHHYLLLLHLCLLMPLQSLGVSDIRSRARWEVWVVVMLCLLSVSFTPIYPPASFVVLALYIQVIAYLGLLSARSARLVLSCFSLELCYRFAETVKPSPRAPFAKTPQGDPGWPSQLAVAPWWHTATPYFITT